MSCLDLNSRLIILTGINISEDVKAIVKNLDNEYLYFEIGECTYLTQSIKNINNRMRLLDIFKTIKEFSNENLIIISEIEAYLHPIEQNKLIKEMIAMFPKHRFIITTNSPYILTTINNSIEAYNTYSLYPNKEKEISEVVAKELWLQFDQVQAFNILNNKYESILDNETNLINAPFIDSVSDKIGEVFDKLLDIKYPLN